MDGSFRAIVKISMVFAINTSSYVLEVARINYTRDFCDSMINYSDEFHANKYDNAVKSVPLRSRISFQTITIDTLSAQRIRRLNTFRGKANSVPRMNSIAFHQASSYIFVTSSFRNRV